MQRRADSVRIERTRKAVGTGMVRSSVRMGGDGPVRRRCRSRPIIKGLAFGFYGKWSLEVDGFTEEVASKDKSTPGRRGGTREDG